MSSVINTNMFSIHAQRQLDLTHRSEQVSMERLSSGERINQAKDDAYGIAHSGKSTIQIAGYSQSIRNSNDGISMLQVADGAMGNITDTLQRMRELSLQSASGSYSIVDHNSMQTEFESLQSEIKNFVENTSFNGISVLNRPEDQASKKLDFQVGASFTELIEHPEHKGLDIDVDLKGLYKGAGLYQAAGSNVSYPLGTGDDRAFTIEVDGVAAAAITLDAATRTTTEWAVELEAKINADPTLSAAGKSVSINYDAGANQFVMLSDSDGQSSTVKVTDGLFMLGLRTTTAAEDGQADVVSLIGLEPSERQMSWKVDDQPMQTITLPAEIKTPFQWATYLEGAIQGVDLTLWTKGTGGQYLTVESSQGESGEVSLFGGVTALGLIAQNTGKVQMDHYNLDDPSNALGALLLNTQKISSQSQGSAMLSKIDSAIDFINQGRSHFAAVENQIATAAEYLDDARMRTSSARSAINDTDFAAESAEMAKMDILKQVGTAMMAQANQLPKQLLQLFK
jgi:flagellin